jgi:protein-tyrosine phosphatase
VTEVLFVCTGNLCRSPSAAWFFGRLVQLHGPDDVRVESAGIMGSTNDPPKRLLKEGAAFGLDLTGHVSSRIDLESIRRADLIIGMAREHVREIVLADVPSFAKTFTLREVVRRANDVGPRGEGESLVEWLFRLGSGRRHLDLIGDSPLDDTPDPMGGFSDDFRLMLLEVAGLTQQLYAHLWPALVPLRTADGT